MRGKNVIILATLIVLCSISSAQLFQDDEGLYYNDNDELYTGTYIEFYSNGNKRLEINLKNGVKEGQVFIFFENGSVNEIQTYDFGKMDGTWTTWNIEGVKTGEANYRNDQKDGEWKIWDDNGTLRFEMHYKSGKKVGVWKMYDGDGNLIDEKSYEN